MVNLVNYSISSLLTSVAWIVIVSQCLRFCCSGVLTIAVCCLPKYVLSKLSVYALLGDSSVFQYSGMLQSIFLLLLKMILCL